MKNFVVLVALLPYAASVLSAPYEPSGFRPSQPFPLPDRIRSQIPAKQYGPPKPEYGVPKNPDDTVEPTTPPTSPRDTPSKFDKQNLQNQANFVFPNRQTAHLSQQSLPEFGQKLFRPNPQAAAPISQALPNAVPSRVFNAKPIKFQQSGASFEIQKSQQLRHNDDDDFNFNNQNNLNVQAPSLPGLLGFPLNPDGRNNNNQNHRIDARVNRIPNAESQAELLDGNRFSNDGFLAAKRASSPRRGGKVTSPPPPPARQYIPQVTSTEAPVAPPTPIRRRKTTTQPPNDEESIPQTPNVSVANAFSGRLFLLQPDGRLEPVILRRANPNPSKQGIVSAAELTQPFIRQV